MDHLLLHCTVARELWTMVFSLFGVNWVMLKGIMELLASWKGNFNMGNNVGIWGISHCLMWGIWWEQNAQTFERCERSVDDLKLLFLKTLLE